MDCCKASASPWVNFLIVTMLVPRCYYPMEGILANEADYYKKNPFCLWQTKEVPFMVESGGLEPSTFRV